MTKLLAQVNVPTNFLGGTNWLATIDRILGTGACVAGGIGPTATCNFQPGVIITVLIPNVLMIAGIIFFVWIMIAGWGILASGGKEANAQEKAKAQASLTYAVIGFLIVVTSFFILQIIERVTGVNFINPI